MRIVIRKLTERETRILAPVLARYRQTQQLAAAIGAELERGLALAEARFDEEGMLFDFETLEFYRAGEPPA